MRLIDANAFREELLRKGFYPVIVAKTLERQPTIEAVPLDGEYIKQIRWERDVALEQLADIGCELGRDMTDIKEKLDIASDKEYKLELTRHELDSLKTFIRNHNQPCRDCMMDYDCDVFLRSSCIAKNMDDVLRKLNKLG